MPHASFGVGRGDGGKQECMAVACCAYDFNVVGVSSRRKSFIEEHWKLPFVFFGGLVVLVFGREGGWRLPATLFGRRPEEVKMQHPTRKYLRVSKKRRVTMRVLLTSVTIELGVKATTFDEER